MSNVQTVPTVQPRGSSPLALTGKARIISWGMQVLVVAILAQTLFFKFTYAPETQVIFGPRGGRPAATAVGIVELVCAVLLLIPKTAVWGAVLALVTICGAIFTHLTSLGIAIVNPNSGESDGGFLFLLAIVVAVGSLAVIFVRRRQLSRFKFS
jgi:LPXTG-motif cell wall-anchored protein